MSLMLSRLSFRENTTEQIAEGKGGPRDRTQAARLQIRGTPRPDRRHRTDDRHEGEQEHT